MATKIFWHIPDDYACTIYRAAMPMLHLYNELSMNEFHVTGADKPLKHEDFDIYIFNRLIRPDFYNNIVTPSLLQGKKFIWQCDDNLWEIPKWNPVNIFLNADDLNSTNSYLDHAKSLWVSTYKLAEFVGRPEKTRVLPNLIDVNQFDKDIVHNDIGPLKIVWCGSASHDKDLDVIVEPIIKILEKYGDKIAVIFWGYLPTQLANFERHPGLPHANLIPKYKNSYFGDWFSQREYFYKLRELKPDIAIMPLDDCEFNHSKSNLKYLEMSMAGAVCVATDLPPYDCVENKKTGLLVSPNDEQGWYDALDELIQNKEYRHKLNNAAREQVKMKYTWQCPARQLWLQAFIDLTRN